MIRRATAGDAVCLLALMRKLAEFEGYVDRFAVTENDLIERALNASRTTEFAAWVAADNDSELIGYAVAYAIPFTFDLRPTVVLKELFVDECARGQGVGAELFAAVMHFGRGINARLLRWQVLPSNAAAMRFYRKLGGDCDAEWQNWVLDIDASSRLG